MKKTKIIDIVQALETRGIKTGIGKGNGINGDYIELTLRAGNSPVTTSFDIESVSVIWKMEKCLMTSLIR